MFRKFLIGAALLLVCGSFTFGQGIRASGQITSSIITPGPLSTVPTSVVAICTHPANAVPCTNKATTYTDITLGTPCSTSTQVVLDGTTSCVNATDNRGNWGVWIAAGTYDYTITVSTGQSFGPFWFTAGGTGGGGGSGTVGPCGTSNALAKFGTSTSVICSSATDDGTTPTRTPNGINSASGPLSDEWLVDTGGVIANHLACRSASSAAKVINCPAGATLTVIGVAQSTQPAGNTVIIEYGAKANVCSTNNTTINDFLIPSLTTPGCVDDTGSASPPTTKTFTWPAETAVTGGSSPGVQITNASLDTLIASLGGGLPSCLQFSLLDQTAAGTAATYGCINEPTGPNGAVVGLFAKPTGVAVNWQVNQFGVLPRALASSDSIGISDIAPGIVECSLPTCTVTVPDIGATGFAQNPVFKAINGNGTLTFNRTSTSNFIVKNGNSSNTVTTFSIGAGSYATFQKDADGTDWAVTVSSSPSFSGNFPSGTFYGIPSTYTLVNADNGNTLNVTGVGNAVITLPKPGSIASSPLVGLKFNSNVSGLSTFTSGAYTQTAGNQMYIAFVQGGSNQTVTSISDSRGDLFTPLTASSDTLAGNAIYYCNNLLTSGSTTFTISFSGAIGGNSLIFAYELTGTSHDNSSSASQNGSVTLPLTNVIHFQNAIAIAGGRTAPIIPAPPFVQLDTVANGNIGEVYYRLFSNQASSTAQMPGNNTTVFQTILSISGVPLFVGGNYVIITNTTSGVETLTPTSSTIDGFTSLPLYPNETCLVLSNGANWNSNCWFSNATAGVVGGNVTIYAADQTAGTTSIGATNMLAPTAASPISRFMMSGYADVTSIGASCAGATTVVLNAIFTDPNGAGTTTKALGTFTINSNGNNGTLGDNFSFPPIYFKAKVSTNIQFSTTYTAGGSCSPAPTVQVTPILQAL